MGSLSLIIVLIIVVWVIVLAPIVMDSTKPIRHSGDGYDATRVLHSGGSEPVAPRRRPKLSTADVHQHDHDDAGDFEVVEAVEVVDAVQPSRETVPAVANNLVEGEVVGEVVAEETGGSTALSVLRERDAADAEHVEPVEQGYYDLAESYSSPADYGYGDDAVENAVEDVVEAQQEPDTEPDTVPEIESEGQDSSGELTEEEIAFAQNRSGRGGWDPVRERAARADRFQRRQRTLLGLIIADVLAFVAAFVAGGWVWALPALTIALTVWYMVALRFVVRQERALHARRVRQLRRARLGVVTAQPGQRRVPGAIIVELDDESPDFANLASSQRAAVQYEYDDYHRAS